GTGGDGGQGGLAGNGGHGGAGATGGAGGQGGAGDLTLTDSRLLVRGTVELGASAGQGSDGGHGGNGGQAGQDGVAGQPVSATAGEGGAGGAAGNGGNGGMGAQGGNGGDGTLTLSNSALQADTLVLGGRGQAGGNGGHSGLTGKDATGGTDLTVTGGNGGDGGHAGLAGDGLLTVESGRLDVQSGILLGGAGGNGGNGGDLLQSVTLSAGNGGNGSEGGTGTLIFRDGVINNTGQLVLGGSGGSAGQAGLTAAGITGTASTGGLAGNGGAGYARFEQGAGSLGTDLLLGAAGGLTAGSVSAGQGGTGTLLIQNGDFTSQTLLAGGASHGQQMTGETDATAAQAGEGYFTLEGGTFRTGQTTIGATDTAGTSQGHVAVTGGVMATDRMAGLHGTLSVGGESGAALLTGTQDTGWHRWQKGRDWLEGRLGRQLDGTLVITGGQTLDLSSPALDWQVGRGMTTLSLNAGSGNGFGDDSLTIVDAKAFVDSGQVALKTGGAQTSASAQLLMIADDNLKTGDRFALMDGNNGWQSGNVTGTSRLLDTALVTDGTGTSTTVDGADLNQTLSGLRQSVGNLLSRMAATLGVNTQSDNQGQTLVSRATDIRYIASAADSVKIVESALNIAEAGGVQASAVDTGLLPTDRVQQHLSLTRQVPHGDGVDVWVTPLYGHRDMKTLSIDGRDSRAESNYGGLMLGSDWTFSEALAGGDLRTGAAFSVGAGQNRADSGISPTRNNFSYRGVNLYSGWNREAWNVMADAGYTYSSHHVTQTLPDAMEMSALRADMQTDLFTAGLRGEYRWQTSLMDVIPYAGARWARLSTDGSRTRNSEGTVAETSNSHDTFWQFPVGVSVARDFTGNGGLNVRPWLDVGYVHAAGDTRSSARVSLPGLDGTAETGGRLVDRDAFRTRTGVELQKNNWSVGLSYDLQTTSGETDHSVVGSVTYHFR
ncbi:autotransporter outer membrane beta-barrel domain-containing protein, partial [Salmonella enterica]|nr:autotransporter outer membrane beta-barrel domain-containing protein [Salmonella enterica]ECJ5721838.1 autotransporter outer membrane beta-barrel domain-containing protein [Salmonella enterica]